MPDSLERLLALTALILVSPLMLIIAIAIFICSPGNPLFRAIRIGRNGEPFGMWKFRTMVQDASTIGPPITGNRDPRVIPSGQFLRRSKLDELPQFLNVVLGDMSLIGPRPESPEIVKLYTAEQRQVLAFKPGMTGKVQLDTGDESLKIPAGAQADDFYVEHLMRGKLASDLEYMRNRTLLSDIKILFSTAGYVFRIIARG